MQIFDIVEELEKERKKNKELEERINNVIELIEAIEYIEKICEYDKHLQGYNFGLKPGEVKTLVYKLGGRNVKD